MENKLSEFAIKKNDMQQRGVALFVVIIFVMLSMLLALWAARGAFFNEILVSNDADYQRTFEAAQAMLQDAEFDIRGVQPDGQICNINPDDPDICRRYTTPPIYFDIETKDLSNVLSEIRRGESENITDPDTPTVNCYKGMCNKRAGVQDFWNDSDILKKMMMTGARYGQFTGAKAATTANPILVNSDPGCSTMCARYWVEILPYMDPNIGLMLDTSSNPNVQRFAPASDKRFVYRITALARGMKPGSEVVLQSTLSIQKAE